MSLELNLPRGSPGLIGGYTTSFHFVQVVNFTAGQLGTSNFFFLLKIPPYLQSFPMAGLQGLELSGWVQDQFSMSSAKLLPQKLTRLAEPTG